MLQVRKKQGLDKTFALQLITFIFTLLIFPQVFAAPVAKDDGSFTPYGKELTVFPLLNDSADNGTTLFIRWATQPKAANSGTSNFTNTAIRYTPADGFRGRTRIWYSIQDSTGKRSSAFVTIIVGNPPFPFAGADNVSTSQSLPLTISPLVNDTGSLLRITAVNAYSVQGSRQRIVGSNQILYTPSSKATGADTFWYQITDDQGRKNSAKITVAVIDPDSAGPYPTASPDSFLTTANIGGGIDARGAIIGRGTETQIVLRGVLQNDTGPGLTINSLNPITRNGGRAYDNGDGTITYVKPLYFTGIDSFWYTIRDAFGRTNAAKVSVDIRAICC